MRQNYLTSIKSKAQRKWVWGLIPLVWIMATQTLAHDGFSDTIEKVSPSVVSISTQVGFKNQNWNKNDRHPDSESFDTPFYGPPEMQEFFDHFFGHPQTQPHRRNRGAPPRKQGSGAGFIIDSKGWIITNHHVIDHTIGKEDGQILVTLHDGTKVNANLHGFDKLTDIALLKIDTDIPLKAASFGNSDRAKVGDWVIAIGNPFGFGGTATAGIISSFGRDLENSNWGNFIQTDAAINLGNSGGPLLNVKGEVIGINTAIWSPVQANIGIGFAIPSNTAEYVIDQLKKGNKPQRGWLGVHIQSLQPDLAESLGRKGDTRGALVTMVVKDSPAEKAGIEEGDLIVFFEDKRLSNVRELISRVSRTAPNQKARIKVWRDNRMLELDVNITKRPASLALNEARSLQKLGLELSELPIDDQNEGMNGVRVESVAAGGLAQESRLRRGDIIVRVNRQSVDSPDNFSTIIDQVMSKGQERVLLLVQRGSRRMFLTLYLN